MSNLYPLICLLSIALAIFISGILLGYAPFRLKQIQNKGEKSVHDLIISNFKHPQYHLLNNVTIPFQDGTTQIDHILISTKGVFVIETKHYSGWIFGNEKSKQWAQIIYRVKNKFQNPLNQNYRHVIAVCNLLDFLPKEHIHSIVVFSGNASFKTPVPKNVLYLNQLVDYLVTFQDNVISENRLQFCVGRLECNRYQITRLTDVQHHAYLIRKHGDEY